MRVSKSAIFYAVSVVLDLATTYYAIYFRHLYELNPLVRFLLNYPILHIALEIVSFILLIQIAKAYSIFFGSKKIPDFSFVFLLFPASFRSFAFLNNVLVLLS